jgi:hypothetical protein
VRVMRGVIKLMEKCGMQETRPESWPYNIGDIRTMVEKQCFQVFGNHA